MHSSCSDRAIHTGRLVSLGGCLLFRRLILARHLTQPDAEVCRSVTAVVGNASVGWPASGMFKSRRRRPQIGPLLGNPQP